MKSMIDIKAIFFYKRLYNKICIRTKPNDADKRNELYYIAQGIDYLERKMTEYTNEIKEIE